MEPSHQKFPKTKSSAKDNFYIIPGWCDTTGRAPYQRLAEIAIQKGYNVVKINPEWDEPLSGQTFPTTKNDIIFGFSMGAILACMVGKKYPCKKLILASMTPVLDLSKPTLNMLGKRVAEDCKKFRYGGLKATYFYGEKEIDKSLDKIKKFGIKVVPNTCHQLNVEYIEQISKEL
jgi:predicted CoA-binding protein